MNHYNETDERLIKHLFEEFVDMGLHGRFEEALELIEEPYTGIGMGEQGIVKNKKEAELVLRGGYRPEDSTLIEYEIQNLLVNFLDADAATALGKVDVTNKSVQSNPIHSGLMQTIGARRSGDKWKIAFTHASPTVMTVESVEAYPIRFMDRTISLLKAGLQTDNILYTEINLTHNSVIRLEAKTPDGRKKPEANTLEEVIRCGLYGDLNASETQEYYSFWNRLRLLGLFAEGVTEDHFDYDISTTVGKSRLRSSVEMVREGYSGDVLAVISYSNLDNQKQELEQFTHKAFHDSLTGILNRDGFERRAEELLRDYDPKNTSALFMIDLDDFKQINDRLGHQMGDTVLRQVATVLRSAFRGSDAVGRVGGDEFMVMLSGDISFAFLEKKAEDLLNSMKLCMGGSKQIPVSVSIGIACGRGRATFDKLYRIADIAMYTAKKTGKCRYHLIHTDTNTEYSYSGVGANLLSLQTLLDYTDGKEIIQNKTPYEALLENIPGGVVVLEVTDTYVKLTHCNRWFDGILDYSNEELAELQKDDAYALVHPDDIPLLEKVIEEIKAGLDSFNVIYRVRHKAGHYRHIAMAASTTERRQGCVILYGIDTDMEEVVKLKQEVEEEQKRLESLVNTMPGGVVSLRLTDHLELTHCNTWISRFLGYTQEELERLEKPNVLSLVHSDDIPVVVEAINLACTGVADANVIYRILDKDNLYRHVRLNASLIETRGDEKIYYGVITDVENITAIQEKLEYSHKQMEALLTAIPGGIAVFEITDTLKVTGYGNWFCEFSGYDSDEEIEQVRHGKEFATVWAGDAERTREALKNVYEEGVDKIFLSVRIKCKDGTPRWVDIHGAVIERLPNKVTMYVIYTEPVADDGKTES